MRELRVAATRLAGLTMIVAFAGSATLFAQEQAPADEPVERDQGLRISIHGFLSQAYARSNGNQVLGISEDGTGDYRTAALQIHAQVTPKDVFAVQFQHERLGASPVQPLRDDVELDWIFYEHRFGDTSLRVGKVPIPFGIYNEVRDVGTVLPFYRPATDFYGEGTFTNETVDGVILSRQFNLGSWGLDGDLYYGGWEFLDSSRKVNRSRDAVGVELWLDTPWEGLRIGTGGIHYEVQMPINTVEHWKDYHLSADGDFGRFKARAEYHKLKTLISRSDAGYLQLGFGITSKLTLNGQVEYGDLELPLFIRPNGSDQLDDDYAFGANYQIRQDCVLKVEHHWNEGYRTEAPAASFRKPALKTQFSILSLAVSF